MPRKKLEDFEPPELPSYHLRQVCFNCTFFRRKGDNIFRKFGWCVLARHMYPEIRKMKWKEQTYYFKETAVDAYCDLHQFKGGGKLEEIRNVTGARPIYDT